MPLPDSPLFRTDFLRAAAGVPLPTAPEHRDDRLVRALALDDYCERTWRPEPPSGVRLRLPTPTDAPPPGLVCSSRLP